MDTNEWVIRIPKGETNTYTYRCGIDGIVMVFESFKQAQDTITAEFLLERNAEIVTLGQAKQEDPVFIQLIGHQMAKFITDRITDTLENFLLHFKNIVPHKATQNKEDPLDQWVIARYGPMPDEDGILEHIWGIWTEKDDFQVLPSKAFAEELCNKFAISEPDSEFKVMSLEEAFELLTVQPSFTEWEEQTASWSLEDLLKELED